MRMLEDRARRLDGIEARLDGAGRSGDGPEADPGN